MDILFTILASILMLVGFLVICRSTAEGEDEYYDDEDEEQEQEESTATPPREKTNTTNSP
ncbi:MAG: hypothetical protein KC553_12030 [Nitrospina sp.]|nr:hypothetical protein [Nitrospina sp.]